MSQWTKEAKTVEILKLYGHKGMSGAMPIDAAASSQGQLCLDDSSTQTLDERSGLKGMEQRIFWRTLKD